MDKMAAKVLTEVNENKNRSAGSNKFVYNTDKHKIAMLFMTMSQKR